MGKFKPGIPDDFTLDVHPVNDLGDYLDERPAPRVARKARGDTPPSRTQAPEAPAPAAARLPAPPPPRPADPVAVPADVQRPAPEPRQDASAVTRPPTTPGGGEPPRADRPHRVKAPRREVSMAPDVLRMSDELIDLVRRGSGQRDTTPSELFHALVLLAYDVKDELDAHALPKRGRWGTPTARAYPVEVKNAFLRALLAKHRAPPAGD